MTTPLPNKEVRAALARAALDNADRLLMDASTLLAAGSAPTAHSLTVLALEEVGKAIICCGGLGGADEQATTRERFHREISGHAGKLQRARNFLDVLHAMNEMAKSPGQTYNMAESPEDYLTQLRKQVDHDHAQRLAGLYVDLSNADVVRVPGEIAAKEAETMLTVTRWATAAVRTLLLEGRALTMAIGDVP